MIGKMSREDIAERLGVSVPSLKRAFRGTRLAFHNYCQANPNLVRQVNAFYEKHGNKRTAEQFGIRPKQVEYMVYRYKLYKPRQIRWTEKQILELARMAGLISPTGQAKFFKRPNAYEGSIKSVWMKKFKIGGGSVNGMVHWYAKELVNHKARYIRTKGLSREGIPVPFRRIILWVDMEKCLKKNVPIFIKDAIVSMAEFQRWLHGKSDTRNRILRMIKEREI